MNEKHKSNNGFLLGMLLGGAIVFLVGTNKGRKILKDLAEGGIDALENFSSVEDIEDYISQAAESEEGLEENSEGENASSQTTNGHSFKKRFFKGIKKK